MTAAVKAITGLELEHTFVDNGYRGHVPLQSEARAYAPHQGKAQAPFRNRAEIGHMKQDGRLGRNFLSNRHGDRLNAILCGVGQNGRLLLRWFALPLPFSLRWLYDAVFLRRISPA